MKRRVPRLSALFEGMTHGAPSAQRLCFREGWWYRGRMPFGVSLPELLVLVVVLLLVFGAKRLPEMGRSLGKGMREFKNGISAIEETVTTTPAAAPPVELPSAPPESKVASPSASLADEREQETVS